MEVILSLAEQRQNEVSPSSLYTITYFYTGDHPSTSSGNSSLHHWLPLSITSKINITTRSLHVHSQQKYRISSDYLKERVKWESLHVRPLAGYMRPTVIDCKVVSYIWLKIVCLYFELKGDFVSQMFLPLSLENFICTYNNIFTPSPHPFLLPVPKCIFWHKGDISLPFLSVVWLSSCDHYIKKNLKHLKSRQTYISWQPCSALVDRLNWF